MCGIFGFLSAPKANFTAPGEDFFEALGALLAFEAKDSASVESLSTAGQGSWLEKLDQAQTLSYRWVEQGPCRQALEDQALQERLRDAATRVTQWSSRLEQFSEQARLTHLRDWEFLNRLIVGGKDIAWQLEQDLLANFPAIRGLLANGDDREESEETLGHAWQLNLFLSSLNRLEVRGRDSAGVAVYLRFPDAQALERFLQGPDGSGRFREDLDSRSQPTDLGHGTLLRPKSSDSTLLILFKVANEVGKMGDNVAFLRRSMTTDRFFQAALRQPGLQIQCLAHTRWASNGVISLPNAHPVDSGVWRAAGVEEAASSADPETSHEGSGEILAVLNGDIDNYHELKERFVDEPGLALETTITTDAKIIPIVVGHYYRQSGNLSGALRQALDEFEGSMAIGVMAADRPGEFVCGQKGSGQGLFLGLTNSAVAIASEMYGVVEFTPRYVKADGEANDRGEVFRIWDAGAKARVEVFRPHPGGGGPSGDLPDKRLRTAEITTRDINRGDNPHFFLKEINESVESVRKTLRGKFAVTGDGVRALSGPEVFSVKLLDALRSGKVRRILVIGQGTAAVAAEGVAHLLDVALRRESRPFHVQAFKATELSAHYLDDDMSNCLLIAVSQSGTTTDTNCTVELVRERGAWVLGIVNRRNSDLVYKSHGVLYTSDGRDIEMSVASTKAFYSQNVAGQVLALSLAAELGTIDPQELLKQVQNLERLPEAMEKTLALQDQVATLARRFALRRRYWALAGSGAAKIAANEIRIKLSELCYKSIAVDFLEDKKHIDLSSEPLVMVCASGIPEETISDAVKEVAIFKAHNSIPIVIADEGQHLFDEYAAGTIKVPRTDGPLDYLLATMVGHLFGYHAAATFDHQAERVRGLRASLTGAHGGASLSTGALMQGMPEDTVKNIIELEGSLVRGELEAALNVSTATRLAQVFGLLLGRTTVDVFSRQHSDPVAAVLNTLSDAIGELARPIDAIKHQAKTVTVGISRTDKSTWKGPLWSLFHRLGLPLEQLAETHNRFLRLFEPLVSEVSGATLYGLEQLDVLGRPTSDSTIRVVQKEGCAEKILSRLEQPTPLAGTKWAAVKRQQIYLGYGQTDGRKILILPVVGESPHGQLLLYHLELRPGGQREHRRGALEALVERFEQLKVAVTEGNVEWREELLDTVDNEALFFEPPEIVAQRILDQVEAKSKQS